MKIGLFPLAAKPYHAGHHAMVEAAASENDRVILFVSTSDRKRKGEFPILGSDMSRVWKEEIEKILPGNVEVRYGGSPVRNVYAELEAANNGNSQDTYTVYSDPIDTANNYPEKYRQKNFADLYAKGQVLFAAEENPKAYTRGEGTPNVSGTKMRSAMQQCDFEAFKDGMPAELNAESAYKILCGKDPYEGQKDPRNEAILRAYIRSIL